MGIFAQDTFAGRTVGSGLGAASDGINTWQAPNINSHAIVSVGSNEGNIYYDNAGAGTGSYASNLGLGAVRDVNLSMRFNFLTAFTGSTEIELVARYLDANNFYRAAFVGSHLFFVKKVAGTTTNTSVASFTLTASTYYNLRFQVNGSNLAITIWQDGSGEPAPQWTGTDTDISKPGGYGLVAVATGITSGAGINFDSFLAQSVASQLTSIYVNSTIGNDSNPGTLVQPVATIQQGMNLAAPGSIVHVAPTASTQNLIMYASGTGGATVPLSFPQSSAPSTRIVVQSDSQSAAAIRAPGAAFPVDVKGSYIDFLGFEVGGDNLANMGIHFNGPGCSAQHCYVHDIQSPNATYPSGGGGVVAQGQATTNTLVNACLITNTGTSADLAANIVQPIYLQSTTSAATNNIICGSYSSGITAIHWSNAITITNNIIANTYEGVQIGGTDIGITCDNSVVANNIFDWYGSLYSGGGASPSGTYIVAKETGLTGLNNQYLNNIVWGPTTGTTVGTGGHGPGWCYQLQNSLVAVGTIQADPQFVNYQGDGSGDYHMLSTSPCREAGTATGAPLADYDGNVRPQSAKYDIGPYEYVPGLAVPCRTFIGGSPVFVMAGSLNFDRSIGKNSQASFNVQSDNNTHFQQDQTVRIVDQTSTLVFTGYVTTPKEEKPGFQPSLEHTISCTNQHRLAEKRLVAASYVNKSPGYMVNDIYTNILVAEGVTIGLIYDAAALTDLFPGTGLFPSTTLYPTESVGIVPEATFVYCTVAQAFDALVTAASANGVPYYWMIDHNKQLWFAPYTAVVNPNVIDGTQIDDGHLTGHRPTVTRANPTYRNTQYLLGGVAQTVTQTNIRVGDGNTTAFTMDYDLATVPTVSVNLNGAGYVTKTVGIQGVDTGKDWYWNKGSKLITQDSGGTKLRGPTGATIDLLKVVYVGQYPTVIIDQNNAQISYEQSLDGTTGIVEEAETDSTISSIPNGLAKTSALLTRYAAQGTIFEGMTRQTGYAPGQLVTVNLPDHQLYSVQMLIEDVSASDQIDGLNIWYLIKAVLGPYDQSWVDFFKVLFKSSALSNSINVGVAQSLVIAASGSVSLSPSVTGSATVIACPVPSLTTFPSLTLFPC